MTRTQIPTCTISLLIVILAIATAVFAQDASRQPTPSDVPYISLTPTEFAEEAADLLNKDVEVAGDIQLPAMMSRKSVGTMVDKTSGNVLVQLIAKPGSPALEWLVGGERQTKSHGIFARGKIVMVRDYKVPVLDLTDISKESKVQADADKKARVETIKTKDKEGLVKDVLPPHTNPS